MNSSEKMSIPMMRPTTQREISEIIQGKPENNHKNNENNEIVDDEDSAWSWWRQNVIDPFLQGLFFGVGTHIALLAYGKFNGDAAMRKSLLKNISSDLKSVKRTLNKK
eukprot:TRINITY_DN555924_c0_g1_i1.p1 TRINITY_DN555924_c0_g1~~TRINITY_DN555924_c0_g1_i1.p1  ORF type:complete len:108 (+),score=17.17 TRINITY_DN555924_c0_g1_i1:59-382(+)